MASPSFAQDGGVSEVRDGPVSSRSTERWLIHLEPAININLGQPQRDRFGPGLGGSLAISRSLLPTFLVGIRLRGGILFDGPPPRNEAIDDPGVGTFGSLGLSVRLRPLGERSDPRRGTGLWLEGSAAVMLTGRDIRPALEAGVGWGFELESIDLGPVIRYLHVIQPGSDNIDNRDAKMLLLGIELTFLDARIEPTHVVEEAPFGGDRDYDGILDRDDACPENAEDFDAFEDEDGCPEADNDADGLLDDVDECPNDPEDIDGFEDADGCPDVDNDRDGILDSDDACPDEAEVVNGVDDHDGCPDEGLIELVDDRIVLEERVLFDFQRARVKSRARPVLSAIVALVNQHPEWTRMRVEGHADVRGNANYNRRLSERRARNVLRALIDAGLDQARADSLGFGADNPRDLESTEEAHQRNRRVEFVVLQRVPIHGSEGTPDATGIDSDAGDEGSGISVESEGRAR